MCSTDSQKRKDIKVLINFRYWLSPTVRYWTCSDGLSASCDIYCTKNSDVQNTFRAEKREERGRYSQQQSYFYRKAEDKNIIWFRKSLPQNSYKNNNTTQTQVIGLTPQNLSTEPLDIMQIRSVCVWQIWERIHTQNHLIT